MKAKLLFVLTYLMAAPVWAWPLGFLIPNLYRAYPHSKERGHYRIDVIREAFHDSVVVETEEYIGSLNGAYIRARALALKWDLNSNRVYGIHYGIKKLGALNNDRS